MSKPLTHQRSLKARSLVALAGAAAAALALAGCGQSVAAGNQNAATHPASGIFTSNTVGGGDMSERSTPSVDYRAPDAKAPAVLPAGLASTSREVESAVKGGCWQDSHQGNTDGAYNQLFWYQGACGAGIAGVTVEQFASAAKAKAQSTQPTALALLGRYLGGAVLVNVWSNAPVSTLSALSSVKGLTTLPG